MFKDLSMDDLHCVLTLHDFRRHNSTPGKILHNTTDALKMIEIDQSLSFDDRQACLKLIRRVNNVDEAFSESKGEFTNRNSNAEVRESKSTHTIISVKSKTNRSSQ